MRLIDTSVWIEFLVDSPLGRRLASEMPDRAQTIVPTIVQLELAKWLAREVSDDVQEAVLADTMRCVVVDLDTSIALQAADAARLYRLATADAIIYATALAHDAELLTCDAHFKDLRGVSYFAKVKQ